MCTYDFGILQETHFVNMIRAIIASLVPRPHPQGGKVLVYIEQFPGPLAAACHVIGMTMHRFGMATHQSLSHACSIRL